MCARLFSLFEGLSTSRGQTWQLACNLKESTANPGLSHVTTGRGSPDLDCDQPVFGSGPIQYSLRVRLGPVHLQPLMDRLQAPHQHKSPLHVTRLRLLSTRHSTSSCKEEPYVCSFLQAPRCGKELYQVSSLNQGMQGGHG